MANTTGVSANTANVTTGAKDAMTAVAQVCSTPELLEGIFSHLPVLDLVMATSVCKTFGNAVHASPKLQGHLFMRSLKDTKEYWQLVLTPRAKRHKYAAFFYRLPSPDVARDAILQTHRKVANSKMWYKPIPSLPLMVTSICPLLELSGKQARLPDNLGLWMDGKNREYFYETDLKVKAKALRTDGPSQRWADMFITSPPCRKQA